MDPNMVFLRVRLFCTTVKPHYQAGFDPILRASNLIQHTSPIVIACREGDLPAVHALFTNHEASPFDRSSSIYEQSLLDIVFKEIVLNLDQPLTQAKKMAALCELFKHLVDQCLDSGQIPVQFRFFTQRRLRINSTYILTCSNCFSAIESEYYDCKICMNGEYILCQACLALGKRCRNRQHHEGKLLTPITTCRVMMKQSALESLSSLSYTKEFATYLVDTARIVIHQSIENPFEYAQPRNELL